jgi:hypothetical protein
MARKLNIEYLYIGLNSGFATRLSSMRWEKLISAIKGTGYAGKIGYFGMTNPDGPYYESDHYNTTEGGSSPASFMSLFNFIGVDVYNVIPRARSRQATDPTQSRIAIKSAMQTLLAKTASAPVPILLMLGTPSTHGGATESTFIEPFVASNPIAATKTLDFFQQADVYQAAFEAVNGTATGNGGVIGIISWGYNFLENLHDAKRKDELAMDKSGNIRGKPAEIVCRWWFDHFSSGFAGGSIANQAGLVAEQTGTAQ